MEKYLSDEVPFQQTRGMSMKIIATENGKVDVCEDDIITITVDNKENLKRITRAPIKGTIATITAHVAQTFRANNRCGPDKYIQTM